VNDFGVASDGLHCPFLIVAVLFGYLISLELMDEEVDVVYFVSNALAVFLYYL
jgi:hypothetical protein